MGVKQSKRSVDITETSTKGEIEGFGNEGKVEKIFDGVVEKVAANGHVDGDLQNGGESHQNGMEPVQNGEAATVAAEKIMEKKDSDESPIAEGTVNGTVENGEVNGEAEKPEEKKEKKKEKKEKVVKKKFSFRNFSFSKKDKAKPPKEEKAAGKVEEGIAEVPNGEENKEEPTQPSQEEVSEMTEAENADKKEAVDTVVLFSQTKQSDAGESSVEKISEVASTMTSNTTSDELPPPLPASPPPSEPVIAKPITEEESNAATGVTETSPKEMEPISVMTVLKETTAQVMTDAEQIAIETGKQIEEKATSLLKTVEGRAEESLRTATEFISQNTESMVEAVQNALGETEKVVDTEAKMELPKPEEAATKMEETAPAPVDISNLGSLTPKTEETSDKHEEGAGESLADIPKDLAEEVATEKMEEAINPDSLETIPPPPPPAEETATGE